MMDLDELRESLREEQEEERVKRMWDRIEARRGPRSLPTDRRLKTEWRRPALVLTAAAALLALGVITFRSLPSTPAEPTALRVEGGRPLAGRLPAGVAVELSDDSRIVPSDRAALDVLESSPRTVALALRRGQARFEVTPHGPRTWRVDCGEVTVEVVGTVFEIDRSPDAVTVVVERGSVLVRGEGVPDRVQRLDAAQRLTVPLGAPTERPVPVVEPAPEPSVPPPSARAPRGGDDSIEALLAAADRAQATGRPRAAVAPLGTVVTRYPDDDRAALAAYQLARLRLERLGQPALAARDFARSLALGLPDALREPARAARVTALVRAGDPEAANAARSYLEAHPGGRHRVEIEGVLRDAGGDIDGQAH